MYQHSETLKEKVEKLNKVADVNVSNKWALYIKDKDSVIRLLKGNAAIVDILLDILTKEYEAELRVPRAEYASPNWALLQADRNGYRRAIENFTNLLTIKD